MEQVITWTILAAIVLASGYYMARCNPASNVEKATLITSCCNDLDAETYVRKIFERKHLQVNDIKEAHATVNKMLADKAAKIILDHFENDKSGVTFY